MASCVRFLGGVVRFTGMRIFLKRRLFGDGICGIIVCVLQTFMLWRIGMNELNWAIGASGNDCMG